MHVFQNAPAPEPAISPVSSDASPPLRASSARAWLRAAIVLTLAAGAAQPAFCASPAPTQTQAATFAFDVPAGSLNQVLLAISRQSGQLISFDPALLRGLSGPALTGEYAVEDALSRALAGSGLEAVRGDEGVFIRRAVVREPPAAPASRPAGVQKVAAVAEPRSESQPEPTLETLIVTANKRSEDIQDVARSISAVSGNYLERVGINSATELARSVPSVSMAQSNNNRNTSVFMRGIGTPGSNPGIEASVGIFIDGVYIPAAGPIQANLHDLAAVEFLRGPQGTLYGRNTPVGAINITTRAPTHTNERLLTVSVGDYNDRQISGYVGAGLSDTVAGRMSFWGASRDGYEKNLSTGDDVNSQQQYGLRGRLRWQPTDAVTTDFTAYLAHLRSECCTGETLDPEEPGGIATPGFLAAAAATGHPFRNFITGDHIVDDDREGLDVTDIYGASVAVNVDLPANQTFTSITAFNGYTDDIRQLAADGLPQATASGSQYLRVRGYSQELRIASASQQTLDYLAGVYLFASDMVHTTQTRLGEDANRVLPPNRAFLPTDVSSFEYEQDTRSAAVFGQLTWNLTDTWRLTGGARYSWDEKEASMASTVNPDASAAARVVFSVNEINGLEHRESEATWLAGLQHDITPRFMAYLLAASGYKTGGFNARSAAAGVPVEFGPESSLTYELGIKSTWLDNRLVFNADVYSMKLENFQDSVLNPLTNSGFIVANAGDRRVNGVEAEAQFQPLSELSLRASVAYMDAEFTDYTAGQCHVGRPPDGSKPGTCNYNGLTPAQSPDWSGSLAGEWQSSLADTSLDWFANVDATYSAGKQLEPTLAPGTFQEEVTLVGARLGITSPNGGWRIAAYGRNLTDEAYYVQKVAQPLAAFISAGGTSQARGFTGWYGPPRTWGVEASFRF